MFISRRLFLTLSATVPLLPARIWAADWTAIETEARVLTEGFGITPKHVKIADAAEVVRRVRDEATAGKAEGSGGLVWINGEN